MLLYFKTLFTLPRFIFSRTIYITITVYACAHHKPQYDTFYFTFYKRKLHIVIRRYLNTMISFLYVKIYFIYIFIYIINISNLMRKHIINIPAHIGSYLIWFFLNIIMEWSGRNKSWFQAKMESFIVTLFDITRNVLPQAGPGFI